MEHNNKSCVVAVGSFMFDELIQAIDTPELIQILEEKGFTHLTIQMGRGSYSAKNLKSTDNLTVEIHKFTVLDVLIKQSSLLISHCGAGILLEGLRADDTCCIAVVNETLMDNHQSEIADKLCDMNHIHKGTPSNVIELVKQTLNLKD